MKAYAVLRVAKVKNFGQLKAISNHNQRTTPTGTEHTQGPEPLLVDGQSDALQAWHDRAEAVGFDKSKMRKNAIPAVEFVATVSADWWNITTAEMQAEWLEQTMDFIETQTGKGNILQATMHFDESTPHLHVITAPFIEKEKKARGRGSAGKPSKREVCLSATDFIGGHKSRLEALQTDYASTVEQLGVKRGKRKKETGAKNLNPAAWRAEQAALREQTERDALAAVKKHRTASETLIRAETSLTQADEYWKRLDTFQKGLMKREADLLKQADLINDTRERVTTKKELERRQRAAQMAAPQPKREAPPRTRIQRNIAER